MSAIESPTLMHRKARDTAYTVEQAREYDHRRFVPRSGQEIHESEFRQLRRALQYVSSGASVLEVGCGTGRLLVPLQESGYRVDGADASGAMIDQLRKKLASDAEDVELLLAEAAEIPKPDGTYDLVYAIRLLNQTESPEYALDVVREMVRLAKPGGYVLVEYVNHYRPRWGAARKHTTRLKPAEVCARAARSGAECVYQSGCFALSMQVYHKIPQFLLRPVAFADRVLSRIFPRFCSRCYVLLRAKSTP